MAAIASSLFRIINITIIIAAERVITPSHPSSPQKTKLE